MAAGVGLVGLDEKPHLQCVALEYEAIFDVNPFALHFE
jgi:hypothetical protein